MSYLHDGWTLRPVGGRVSDEVSGAGPIPATVPGSVHTDLLAKEEFSVPVGARAVERIEVPRPVANPDDPGSELLVAEFAGDRAVWFFAEDRDSALPPPRFIATVTPFDGGAHVSVTAEVLLRDLALLVDRADPAAAVDDMLATLLPGETATWTVRGAGPVDADRLLAPDVLSCANQLVDPSRPVDTPTR